MRVLLFGLLLGLILPLAANAQAPVETTSAFNVWSTEAEVGIATVSGNAKSETFTGKDTTSYIIDNRNKLAWTGRYLRATSNGVESSRNWDTALRLERNFEPSKLTAFISYGLESDFYAGYVQRNNADLGLKYDLTRTVPTVWFVEAGYRNTQTMSRNVQGTQSSDLLRLYTELTQALGKSASMKLWVEYLAKLDDFKSYRVNTEPSLVSQLNGIFSLKTGYLVKYQADLVPPTLKHTDSFFTTALVAKF
jgi:putative salt-induced outer membrane protein